MRPSSTSTRSRPAKPLSSRAGRSARRPASTPAARPRTSTPSSMRSPRTSVWWDGNRKHHARAIPAPLRGLHRACARQEAVRAGPLWRRRSEIPDQDARLHRTCLAFAVHPSIADPSRSRPSSTTFVPELTIVDLPIVQGRPEAPRRAQLRHDHRHRLHPQDHPDRQLVLCRRDEEVGLHHAQLLPAGAGRDADALLGQCRQGRRRGAVLRPLRHRQDHALGRSEPHADRRRRARLGPGRRVQLRGRLLRQVHQALAGSRARDLRRHQPLRRGAGKRGVRSGHARLRFRRRVEDREHPLGLSARVHAARPRAPAAPGTRRTSSSSPPTPSA